MTHKITVDVTSAVKDFYPGLSSEQVNYMAEFIANRYDFFSTQIDIINPIKEIGIKAILFLFLFYSLLKILLFYSIVGEINPLFIIAKRPEINFVFQKYNLSYITYPLNGMIAFLFIYITQLLIRKRMLNYSIIFLLIQIYTASLFFSII